MGKKRYKVSYVVTITYPETIIEDLSSNLAAMQYTRQLQEGKLDGNQVKNVRWVISEVPEVQF